MGGGPYILRSEVEGFSVLHREAKGVSHPNTGQRLLRLQQLGLQVARLQT